MKDNETKKTMRFWIFSGIAAIAASQLPLLFKKKKPKEEEQAQQQQGKRPSWTMLLLGAAVIGGILWLFAVIL
ncbi:hypothetical protein [Brevibacillus borstelensis]|uniref:hypothetical protein n=1 Tax=Brevibacillus borstelensis TaxID=45462 RepID=UPI0030C35E0C